MRVLFVRHAIAEDREQFAKTGMEDDLRPLTADGRRKMREVVGGLVELVPRVHVVATSRLVRAVETAALVCRGYGIKSATELPQLAPGHRAAEILAWLKKQSADQTIVLVGHEPDLGRTVSWLLSGVRGSFLPFKKGGACLVEFAGTVESGAARLVWSMRPAQLRRLAKD